MESSKKLIRAKVQLQNENPFFAYLIMNMKFIEKKDIQTMGVDNNGNCYYSPKFVEGLSGDILKGVLAHEVLHVILEHFNRVEQKQPRVWNIATDLCINNMLLKNHFSLADGGLIPHYDEYSFYDSKGKIIKIVDIDKKTADDIYKELMKVIKEDEKAQKGQDKKRFDKHLEGKENELTKEQRQALKDKWKRAVSEASAYARQKGNTPRGLDLVIDTLLNEKINWKHLLYRYLTRTIPHDYTYARPSKRSFSTGVYMPVMKKENIEIVVSLDTSGSISKEELQEFMSEINGIAKSFNNLTMKLIICDSEIKEVYTIGNGDNDRIEELILTGGGGTSHKPIYDYIKENIPNTQLLVNFTDGYTDLNDLDDSINTLWVICRNGINERSIPFGEVIKLD